MRDSRKNQDYFTAYLDYQYIRIQKKLAKLREAKADEDKRQRILTSLVNYEIDLLKAEFSNGASREDLKVLLVRAIDVVKEYKKTTSADLLVLLSLSVMLGAENDAKKIVEANKKVICQERLLNCIGEYVLSKKILWNEDIVLGEEYESLQRVFSSSKKEDELCVYLDSWYSKHSEHAWYGSHLKDTDTYCGYWSFESAALVKMFSIDDQRLCSFAYYPVL